MTSIAYKHGRLTSVTPEIDRKAEEQSALDKQWFEANPERTLYLRKSKTHEREAGAGVQNAVIVAKIFDRLRTRIFLSVKNKPIDKTMDEWVEF